VYTLGSYTKNTVYRGEPNFTGNNPLIPFTTNATGQYVPYYVVGQVSFLESLTPLLGVNFQTVNNVTGRLQYSTSRAVALNTTNYEVTELHTSDITIGLGYAATGFKLPFRVGGEQRTLKNNLQARLDLSIRDNKTIQRRIIGSTDSIPTITGSSTPGTRGNVGTATSLPMARSPCSCAPPSTTYSIRASTSSSTSPKPSPSPASATPFATPPARAVFNYAIACNREMSKVGR
jgi:hypothetical protein